MEKSNLSSMSALKSSVPSFASVAAKGVSSFGEVRSLHEKFSLTHYMNLNLYDQTEYCDNLYKNHPLNHMPIVDLDHTSHKWDGKFDWPSFLMELDIAHSYLQSSAHGLPFQSHRNEVKVIKRFSKKNVAFDYTPPGQTVYEGKHVNSKPDDFYSSSALVTSSDHRSNYVFKFGNMEKALSLAKPIIQWRFRYWASNKKDKDRWCCALTTAESLLRCIQDEQTGLTADRVRAFHSAPSEPIAEEVVEAVEEQPLPQIQEIPEEEESQSVPIPPPVPMEVVPRSKENLLEEIYYILDMHPIYSHRAAKITGMIAENSYEIIADLLKSSSIESLMNTAAECMHLLGARKRKVLTDVPTPIVFLEDPAIVSLGPIAEQDEAILEVGPIVGDHKEFDGKLPEFSVGVVQGGPSVSLSTFTKCVSVNAICPHEVTQFYHCVCNKLHLNCVCPVCGEIREMMNVHNIAWPTRVIKKKGKYDFKFDLTTQGIEPNPGPDNDDAPVESASQVVATANVAFVDEREMTSDTTHLGNDKTLPDMAKDMAERSWKLRDILCRPVHVETFQWSGASSDVIKKYGIPDLILKQTSTPTVNVLRQFAFIRAGVEIELRINGTKFHCGRLICALIPPLWKEDDGYYHINNYPNFPHVFLDASVSNSARLTVPFVHQLAHFPLRAGSLRKETMATLGQLHIAVWNQLRMGQDADPTIDITIYAQFVNPEVHQTTFPIVDFMSSTGIVQAGPEEEGFLKHWTGKLLGAGIKGVLGTMVGGLATGAASFITGLIFDKPNDPLPPERMINYSNPPPCHGAGLDHCVRLSLSPVSLSETKEYQVGGFGQEFDIKALLTRPSRLMKTTWTTSQGTFANLFKIPVSPTFIKEESEDTAYSTYSPTSLAYNTRPFALYRGSIIYQFEVISSQFHTGRLIVMFDPAFIKKYDVTFEHQYQHNVLVFDIEENKQFAVKVDMMSPRNWLRSDNFRGEINFGDDNDLNTYQGESSLGFLYMFVQNRLRAPQSVTQGVDINVIVYGGDDFEVAVPCPLAPLSISRPTNVKHGASGRYPYTSKVKDQHPVYFENRDFIIDVYEQGLRLALLGIIRPGDDSGGRPNKKEWYNHVPVGIANEEARLWRYKVSELLYYVDNTTATYQSQLMSFLDSYQNISGVPPYKPPKVKESVAQGLEQDFSTRSEKVPPTSILMSPAFREVAPETLSENAMNLQTVMRRYQPILLSFPLQVNVGYTVIYIPVTPTFIAREYAPIGDAFSQPVPTNPIAWFCREYTWGRGSQRYMISFDDSSPVIYAWHDPLDVTKFQVLRGVREQDIQEQLAFAQTFAMPQVSGHIMVECPFFSPYSSILLDAHHGLSDRADLRAQNGTLKIAIKNSSNDNVRRLHNINVFMSIGEDFYCSVLKATPNVYEYNQTFGDCFKDTDRVVKKCESRRSLHDQGGKVQSPAQTGFDWLDSTYKPGTCEAKLPTGEAQGGDDVCQIFSTLKKVDRLATKVEDAEIIETVTSHLTRMGDVLSSVEDVVEKVSTKSPLRSTVQQYVLVAAQVTTAGAVLFSFRQCIESPSFGSFLTLGVSLSALIGLATSETIQNLLQNACDWVSNLSSLVKKPERNQAQVSYDSIEDIVESHEETILSAVAVACTVFYAYLFDVLPTWTEIKKKIQAFFQDSDVKELPKKKDRTQGLDLKAAHFSVLGITALNKVYDKIYSLIQQFLDWLLKRDSAEALAARASESFREEMLSLTKEIEDLDYEPMFQAALTSPIVHNRFINAQNRVQDLIQRALAEKQSHSLLQFLRDLKKRISDLVIRLNTETVNFPRRFTPFWVQLSGPAGTGKTRFITEVNQIIKEEFNLSPYNMVYERATNDEFWSGYTYQPIVVWDDMHQCRTQDDALGDLYTIVSDKPHRLNMAAVNDKGRPFLSKAIVSTTNIPYQDPLKSADPTAFRRRIALHIKMEFQPDHSIETVQNVPFDSEESRTFAHVKFSHMHSIEDRCLDANHSWDSIRALIRAAARAHFDRYMQDLIIYYGDHQHLALPRGIAAAIPTPDTAENLAIYLAQDKAIKSVGTAPPEPSGPDVLPFFNASGFICPDGHVLSVTQALSDSVKCFVYCSQCKLDSFAKASAENFMEEYMLTRLSAKRMWLQLVHTYSNKRRYWVRMKKAINDFATDVKDSTLKFIQENPKIVKLTAVLSLLGATVAAVCACTSSSKSETVPESSYDCAPRMKAMVKTVEGTYESGPTKAVKMHVVESAYQSGPRAPKHLNFTQGATDLTALDIAKVVGKAVYAIMWSEEASKGGCMRALHVGGTLLLAPFHFFNHAQVGDTFYIGHRLNAVVIEYVPKRMYRPADSDWCLYDCGARLEPGRHLFKYFIKRDDLGRVNRCRGLLVSVDKDLNTVSHFGELESIRSYEYSDPRYGDTYKQRGFTFHYPTVGGMCGSPMVALSTALPAPGKLLGIHTAGNPNNYGFTVQVTYESLMEAVTALKLCLENVIQPADRIQEGDYGTEAILEKAKIIPEGDYTIHCVLPAKMCPAQPQKTQLIKTPWFDEIQELECPKKPAHLYPFTNLEGERISPLRQALKKYGKFTKPFSHHNMEKAFEATSHYINQNLTTHTGKRIWSEREAIAGIPGVPFAERLNMKSSPGWPYQVLEKSQPGKWYLFTGDDEIVPGSLLRQRLDHRLNLARKGERCVSVWRDCLKDELRPNAKVDEGKTRLFTIAPVDFTIAMRMYCMDFALAFYSANIKIFSAVGINPESLDWTLMYNKLVAMGHDTVAGDFKEFDGKLMPELIMMVCDIINAWYGDGPENARIRMVLFNELIHTLQLVENLVYQSHQGNPSGNPFTVIINTIIGFLYFLLAFFTICPGSTFQDFINFVCSVHYGDDNTTVVHPKYKQYNFNSIREFLLKHGIEYTLDTKLASDVYPDFRPLEEVTFLKRGFRKDADFGNSLMVPTMSKETLYSYLFYYRKAEDIESQLQDNMTASLMFAAFHGKEFYQRYQELWTHLMNKHGFKAPHIGFLEQIDVFRYAICSSSTPSGKELSIKRGTTEGMDKFMAVSSSSPARVLGGLLQAPFYYALAPFGSNKKDNVQRTDPRWAAAIPSGEGKSWLCEKYPHIFVDHDSLLIPHFSPKSFVKGKNPWSHDFARNYDFPVEDQRILLVHHPSDTNRQIIGSFVTHFPSFIRANALQRLQLSDTIRMTREKRNQLLIDFAKVNIPKLFVT